MKIQTVYQNGVLKPIRPLRLKRRMVTVTIADEDIAEGAEHESESRETIFQRYKLSPEAKAYAEGMMGRLAAIRERPWQTKLLFTAEGTPFEVPRRRMLRRRIGELAEERGA